MSTEHQVERDVLTRPLTIIESEIEFYKGQFANSTIEIGKRLIEAKQQLPHGEWGNWLQEKVEFSQVTAQRFMRIAEEFANTSAGTNLGTRKLFLLLDVPQEEREEFISQPHEINGQEKLIDEMTTRELQRLIAEKKAAEEKAHALEEKAQRLEKDNEETVRYYTERLNLRNKTIKELMAGTNTETKTIETVKEVVKEVVPNDYEELKEKLKQANRKIDAYKTDYEDAKKVIREKENTIKAFQESGDIRHGYGNYDMTNIVEFRYQLNYFLQRASAVIYCGEQFKAKTPSEIKQWEDMVGYLERYTEDLRQAIRGNSVSANVIYLNDMEVNE